MPRKPVWFRELFGFDEGPSYATNRSKFQVDCSDGSRHLLCSEAPPHGRRQYLGDFGTPSLAELRAELAELLRQKQQQDGYGGGGGGGGDVDGEQGMTFGHLATPVGVQALIMDPANEEALFQAASQFNCLEMVGPGVSPERGIAIYFEDPTQGPKCAMCCPAATVYRNYLVHGGKGQTSKHQIDCLADVGRVLGTGGGTGTGAGGKAEKPTFWRMENGYSTPVNSKPWQSSGSG
jgi:hypothetical protein